MIGALISELRLALRALVSRPGYSLVVIATLALGIGANAAMFGVLSATVLQPLPYESPERLVRIWETTPEGKNFSASEPNYLDFVERNRSFESLAAYREESFSLQGASEPLRVGGHAVSRSFFELLGAQPLHGRTFLPEEDRAGADATVVILGHKLWQQRFGGDRGLLGETIQFDGRAHVVVGVMPADFDYFGAELWVPLGADAAGDRGDHWLNMIGRLKPGVSIEQAADDLSSIAAQIGSAHPQVEGWGVRLASFTGWMIGDSYRLSAWLLSAALGLLLLMACANLASVLFTRACARQGEMGIRVALGAGRARLVRQLLVEILLLVLAGVVIGLGVAQWTIGLVQAYGSVQIPRVDEIRIDGAVLLFSIAVGLLSGLLSGLLPVLRASRVDPIHSLRQGGRDGVSVGRRRLGDLLVVVQVGLALVLMVGAGLLIRSFVQLQQADTGFDPERLLAVELQLGDRYAEPWQKVVFFSRLAERLRAVPGVLAVGATITRPFSGSSFANDVTPVERAAEAGPSGYSSAHWRAVTPGFFEAAGLPLVRGRVFDAGDRWDGPLQVVISHTLAEQLWPGQDAVGRELFWGGVEGRTRVVIGVVGDYQDVSHGAEPPPLMFLPYNQLPWPTMTVLVRTAGAPVELAAQVREQIRAADPDLAVPAVVPLSDAVADSLAGPRLRSWLLGAFATIALLLAAVGTWGVIAFNVAQRRRELGLRMALGAPSRTIVTMLLLGGARLALIGSLLGLLGAWAMTRFLQGLLYQTAALDPLALFGGCALLAVVVLLASWLPARRAAAADPLAVLRHD